MLHPTTFNATRLIAIPALYAILIPEPLKGSYPEDVITIVRWIVGRASQVLVNLVGNGAPLTSIDSGTRSDVMDDDWLTVS